MTIGTTVLPAEDESAGLATLPAPEAESDLTPAQKDQELLKKWFSPDRLRWSNLDWTVLGFLIFVHAGTLAAPFFFSWSGLAICVGMHWLTCSVGICLGFHRYLAHRSMKLKAPAEFCVTLAGVLSGEGTPLNWAAVHRLHHQKSDQEGDPHSPNQGSWWSHILWLFPLRHKDQAEVLYRRYIPELVDRPVLRFFEKTFAIWLWGSGLVLLAAGTAVGGISLGLSWLLWGMCARMTFAYHSTWFVNSATHLWGYRNYETRDMSRNLWWVAVLAYGEGWHNNHHAHPSVAPAGHKWWEVDITWWSIRFLRGIGQAYEVNDKLPTGTAAAANEND